jgi:hypothetical protein
MILRKVTNVIGPVRRYKDKQTATAAFPLIAVTDARYFPTTLVKRTPGVVANEM